VAAAVAADPRVGDEDVLIPVVAECDDSWLSDARVVQVEAGDAGRALERASSAFARGAVGAGTGMVCFGCKGRIGTASRVSSSSWTVRALVLANFGERAGLRIGGVGVGAALATPVAAGGTAGSCIAVIATDAPLAPAALERVARRAGLGLARIGSVAHHGSGEIFLAFATASAPSVVTGPELDGVFEATVDATEEAGLDALWSAETVTGRDGRTAEALPHDAVLALLRRSR
jgi:D-aminopeptidase